MNRHHYKLFDTTISDTILYEELIPDIAVVLFPEDFRQKNILNRIEKIKFNERKNINNVFDENFREFKTLFDCKIKKNGRRIRQCFACMY
jgi:hypothetical protein